MQMHLNHQPFLAIKNGTKRIEIRLNDDKRSKLKIGDKITFTDLETDQELTATVLKLEVFPTFKDLFQKYSGVIIGSPEEETIAELDQENTKIYSREKEEQFGALAIEIKVVY